MADTESIKLTQRILNGKTYFIGVSLTNPNLQYNLCILDSMIKQIRIDNDLDSFYPKCSIIFQDIDGKYTNLYTHYGQYMQIIIQPPIDSQKSSKNTPKIQMSFLVTNHKLVTYDPKKPQYQVFGVLFYQTYFNKHLNFATNKNYSQQSPYFLIKNILSNAGIDIKRQIPSCTRNIHFISDQNNTVRDSVKYCLMLGASYNDPPTYLYYHIINKQFLLVNRNCMLKQPDYSCNMQLVIPTDKGNKKIDNSLILYNIEAYTSLDTQHFYQIAALEDQWNYDHINRKWIQTIVKPQRYTQLLSFDQKKFSSIKSSFDTQEYQQTGIRLYTTNYEYNIYARLHNLQIGSNCLQFYVQGNAVRDCGQFINITCMDNNFKNIYGGLWQTYSVTHLIQGDRYSNIINAYRTFNNNYRPKN